LIAEPWDFTGPWGNNRLEGQIVAVGFVGADRRETVLVLDLGHAIHISGVETRFCLLSERDKSGRLGNPRSNARSIGVNVGSVPMDVSAVDSADIPRLVQRSQLVAVATIE
jgi:hypothetical protein